MRVNATTLASIWVKTVTLSGGGAGISPTIYYRDVVADISGDVVFVGIVSSGES